MAMCDDMQSNVDKIQDLQFIIARQNDEMREQAELIVRLSAEADQMRLLLTKSRTLLLNAVMHGMPITDDVLEVRNWQPLPALPAKEE